MDDWLEAFALRRARLTVHLSPDLVAQRCTRPLANNGYVGCVRCYAHERSEANVRSRRRVRL